MTANQPEQLDVQAQAALAAEDSNRGPDLLKRIVSTDENYEDASRLPTQWWNDGDGHGFVRVR